MAILCVTIHVKIICDGVKKHHCTLLFWARLPCRDNCTWICCPPLCFALDRQPMETPPLPGWFLLSDCWCRWISGCAAAALISSRQTPCGHIPHPGDRGAAWGATSRGKWVSPSDTVPSSEVIVNTWTLSNMFDGIGIKKGWKFNVFWRFCKSNASCIKRALGFWRSSPSRPARFHLE